MTSHEPSWTASELLAALDVYEQQLREAGKARNTINTYVQHPERFIRWLVGTYTVNAGPPVGSTTAPTGARSKYTPLGAHLSASSDEAVSLTFSQIERILGFALPASARRYPAWWANESSGSHSHARSWLDVGRHTTRLNLNAGTVDFVRATA